MVLAILIIRYIHPVGYIVGTAADSAYHLFSGENLGWISNAPEWGSDSASFVVGLLSVIIIAWLLSRFIPFIFRRIRSVTGSR
ncbi:hypothetical protein DSJ_19980 [Pantoea stewartii subsp. stewartii DC283]|uniref:Uncharacterized protein n=2 Tax=Pantoea stewartii TaxID=66269 RepID=H3R9Q9_PANSE|nr:hypothetical protein DSJ_19980 [Pantoea stewartii subsp. stewartii DC283]EHU01922.1 hypothetical protein CKS_0391 [Pantoea stewartii subsp. stewartii DC283]